MATSTNMGWTLPDDTDLVKNGALAIRTLGNAIDTNLSTVTFRTVAGTTDTLVLDDLKFKLIQYSSTSNVTITIPLDSSVAFPVGCVINIIKTGATGDVTIQGDAGVTVNSASGATPALTAQYTLATCVKLASDSWVVFGNI